MVLTRAVNNLLCMQIGPQAKQNQKKKQNHFNQLYNI